jgi:hypothetical protein
MMKTRTWLDDQIHGALVFLLWLAGSIAWGSDVVSDFSGGNEGWVVADVNFIGTSGFPANGALTNVNQNPPVDAGKLRVVDVAAQWTWAIAPPQFQGDWRSKASVQAEITASSTLAIGYPVMFWISDSRTSNGTNAAYHLFPQAMTVSGGTTNYFVTLNPTNWVVTSGSWANLIQSVSEFWIRVDLTSGCGTCPSAETDWLDNVILKQRWLSALRIALRGETVLLDWTGEAGASLQKCGSLIAPLWQIVPGTTGASHYEEPATNRAAFYRLIQ